jgi:sulfur-oxidizing protein SoxB
MADEMPHIVGEHLLNKMGWPNNSSLAHAFSCVNFNTLAEKFGAMGGFAHMATLIKQLRENRPGALLLDGGDTWQGSATALWTNAQDMVDASLLLGVDVMTGHWEFTYGMDRVKHVMENDFKDKINFVAQNVLDLEFEDPVFEPYTIKEQNGVKIAIIGQAFPFTPIANPRYMVKDWQFGIREERLQQQINDVRDEGAQVVVLLSHNGLNVDMKLASRVRGLDAIFSGHTHDALPIAYEAKNSGGTTLVINSGSMGKFVASLDLDVKAGKVRDYQFNMIPVFSNAIKADKTMQAHIDAVRKPYLKKLNEELAVSNELLYRRGTFNGTFDQLICDTLIESQDAEISFSPGFRWGMSMLPGQPITYEDVMTQTAITYPEVVRTEIKGELLKTVLEDIADNRFNPDPYFQQGGDMVRVGGLEYSIDISAPQGKRISDMTIKGQPVKANKSYIMGQWASVSPDVQGKPMCDVVADYLRDKKVVSVSKLNMPKIKNVPGKYGDVS